MGENGFVIFLCPLSFVGFRELLGSYHLSALADTMLDAAELDRSGSRTTSIWLRRCAADEPVPSKASGKRRPENPTTQK